MVLNNNLMQKCFIILSGLIIDSTHEYSYTLYLGGGAVMFGVLLMILYQIRFKRTTVAWPVLPSVEISKEESNT